MTLIPIVCPHSAQNLPEGGTETPQFSPKDSLISTKFRNNLYKSFWVDPKTDQSWQYDRSRI